MRGTPVLLACMAACVGDEARLPPPEEPTCPAGQAWCGGACVDVGLDPMHCGACDNPCDEGKFCSVGQCGDTCMGGTTPCGNLCGCPANQVCTMNVCAPACDTGEEFCDGECVETTDNPNHCGGCNIVCSAAQLCIDTGCVDATSCLTIKELLPAAADGVFTIDPDGGAALPPVETYCDMTTDGGGWTLLAKTVVLGLTPEEEMTLRESYWADYTDTGYGDPDPSSRLYWMPLKHWHALTSLHPGNLFWQKSDLPNQVRVQNMSIDDASAGFAWSWTATEPMFLGIVSALNGRGFTARDVDNDNWPNNCSVDNVGLNGGFWYSDCQQLSMLHVDGNVYRLDQNIQTALMFSELYLR